VADFSETERGQKKSEFLQFLVFTAGSKRVVRVTAEVSAQGGVVFLNKPAICRFILVD